MQVKKAIKVIFSGLALIIICLGVVIWRQHASHQDALKQLAARHEAEIAAKHQEMQNSLSAQADQHQQAIQTLNNEYEQKLAALQRTQRDQLAGAYKEFENIFDGNKKTIDYINLLEDKMKAGQNISKAELERLAVITTGLGYLQKQYQKPLEQFSELAAYFEKQAAMQPEKPKGNFFKRVFSKEFREAQKEFHREEGMKQAFDQAQDKFSTVYAVAQRQMAAVNLDADAQVKKLHALMDDIQQANQEDLSAFFDQARKALKTHQDVLKFEPENLPLPPPKVQP